MDLMDLMDLMYLMDSMDLISAFHMDLDWILIYELVENGLWIGFGYDFNPSGPTDCNIYIKPQNVLCHHYTA